MNYMNMKIKRESLLSQKQVRDVLSKKGMEDSTDYHALEVIFDWEYEHFRRQLTWRYPISDGLYLGGYLIPVKEGMLYVPYHDVDRKEGEQLLVSEAKLMDAECCGLFAEDMQSYADGLCDALNDMKRELEKEKRA